MPLRETPYDTPEDGISGEAQHAIGQERHDCPGDIISVIELIEKNHLQF
jgi:hypothetical protein